MAYTPIPGVGGSSYRPIPSTMPVMNSGYRLVPSGFTPETIATLVLDLNADTVPGADGASISPWPNQAAPGAVNDFVQAAVPNQPVIKRGIINGRSTMLFDPSVNTKIMTSSVFLSSTTWTIFFVFQLTTLPAGGNFFRAFNFKNSLSQFATFFWSAIGGAYQPYSFQGQASAAAVGAVGIADALDLNPHIIGITFNNGNQSLPASYTCSLDGVNKTVLTSGAATQTGTNNPTIGADSPSGATPAKAHYARALVFNTVLSAANYSAVSAYLKGYYGIGV